MLAICDQVSRGLRDAGIDPARAVGLRRGEMWAELPPLGGKARNAVAEFAAAAQFDAKIQAMVPHFRRRPTLDLADSSLAELYAWCIAQQGRQPGDPL